MRRLLGLIVVVLLSRGVIAIGAAEADPPPPPDNPEEPHPRPPEPLDNQDSTPRDAELVLVGRAIGDDPADPPTIVTGDLNDVAWSYTTRLFLRLSGLLDPRIGRGFFNSYNARNPLFRFPLDHFFHSNDFRLIELRRLDFVGSDHFPMYLALSYEPARQEEQPEAEADANDREQADEMVIKS